MANTIGEETIKKGAVYINLMENDLLVLLSKVKTTQLTLWKDVGIISYNETPWKQLILNGITTISADFKKMGKIPAQIILNKEIKQVEVPFTLT